MLKMLVVLVIVVRPHTGTLRGLRRRLFSRLVTDPRSGADRRVATRARNTYDSDHHTGVRGPLDPQKIFACGGRYLLKNTPVSCTLSEPDPTVCRGRTILSSVSPFAVHDVRKAQLFDTQPATQYCARLAPSTPSPETFHTVTDRHAPANTPRQARALDRVSRDTKRRVREDEVI